MTNRAHEHRGTILALAGLLAVGAFLLPLASAAPTFNQPNPNAPPQQWAYGGSYGHSASSSASGWGMGGNWSYTTSSHGFLAWNVIFTQTNTSSTTFTLQEQRTLRAAVYVSASCTQGCGATGASANLTAVAWETDNAFANLTTTGTVYVNGTATPAVAVENAQSYVAANATAVASWSTSANSGSAYLSAAATAQAQVTFTPPLGLFPVNPVPGTVWNSSSTYAATGDFTLSCHYDDQNSLGASNAGNCGSSGSLQSSGPVTVYGADLGRIHVNGQSTDELAWHMGHAPFRFADGAILLPASADLTAGAGTTTAAGPAGAGVGAMSTDNVNYAAGGSHLGVIAAHATLTSSAAGGVPVGAVSQASPAAGANSPAQYGAQAQPESVAQAQASNSCLMSGCGAASHASGLLGGLGTLVVAAVAVLALVGALIYLRRPKAPTSVAPYNPGTPASAPSSAPQHAQNRA